MRRWLIVGMLALGACEGVGGEAEESPELLNQRRLAYRQACATGQLLSIANEDVLTLEDVAANASFEGPLAEINRRASAAALEYARAYQQHAELRAAAHAALDSAVNHSATRADSARYVERAGSFTIRSPLAGSVEENVIRSYVENYTSLLGNPDHPCNWDLPF